MKKNKGFSIVELIVSFSLTMIIVVILFEIIISLKNVYESSVTKSALISKQNILTDYIYSDIEDLGLLSVGPCGNNCIQFMYETGDVKNLSWEYEYDETNRKQSFQKIQYGDYAVDLIANSKFDLSQSVTIGDVQFKGAKICSNIENYTNFSVMYVNIKLPIYNSKFENQNFGLNIFHVFDLSNSSHVVDLPSSNNC